MTTNRVNRYLDLLTELMAHTWLVLLFAISCVALVYLLQIWSNVDAFFICAEIPALLISTFAVFPDSNLRLRLPWLWTSTALLVWAICNDRHESEPAQTLAVVATCLVLLYWLARAIHGSCLEYLQDREGVGNQPIANILAGVLSLWGGTLQLAFLASLLTKPLLVPILGQSVGGRLLRASVDSIRLTSPWFWAPTGLWTLGLFLYATLRLREDPYNPPHFDEIIARFQSTVYLRIVGTAFAVPLWVFLVIVGFLYHLVKKVFESFGHFLKTWVGRLFLMITCLVLPTIILMAGHWFAWKTVSQTADYLALPTHGLSANIFCFLDVHACALLALCLYLVSVATLGADITRSTVRQAIFQIRQHVNANGRPASDAIGRAYALYATLIIAIPIGSALPGGYSLGLFSVAYLVLFVALLVLAWYRQDRGPLELLERQIRNNFNRLDTESDGDVERLKQAFQRMLGSRVDKIVGLETVVLFDTKDQELIHPWPFHKLSPEWQPFFEGADDPNAVTVDVIRLAAISKRGPNDTMVIWKGRIRT